MIIHFKKLVPEAITPYNLGNVIAHHNVYKIGDRIGQLIIVPIPTIELVEKEELSDSNRNEGGFGHTGN